MTSTFHDPCGPGIPTPLHHAHQLRVARGERAAAPADALVVLDRTTTSYESFKAQHRARVGMNTHARMVVSQLWTFGAMRMNEISARVAISRGALTDIVDRLEEDGYVERRRDSRDRRCTLVNVTPRLWRELRPANEPFEQELCEWTAELDDDAWILLREFLDLVHDRAEVHSAMLRGGRPRVADGARAPSPQEGPPGIGRTSRSS